ncbi:lipase 2 [Gnomoniopsis smithogilvyi]|uniref:Lipase 2 n=1 Tax=Gnomoniopsis smithogilvyi TaxID=1191159 RepID=A0A9W8Z1K3_9PEZI|nr:lipase 2 [Gnomoniopsis smithogilvyi]
MPTKHPIVLAHGLFGFAELKLAGSYLPPIHYWRGIQEALTAHGREVITATVPPSGTIAERAAQLRKNILAESHGRPVNIIAHSMGGLDARYMISKSRSRRTATTLDGKDDQQQQQQQSVENDVNVRALVTIATPHHGSAYADYLLEQIGPTRLPTLYRAWTATTGLGTGAFDQLTRAYMRDKFNPATPDDPATAYFSYGAALVRKPPLLSPFRASHAVLVREEGPNDGLVSVDSARWGSYKGTLEGVNHLDLINWTNRLRWTIRRWMGEPEPFNAVAFYLEIADMLDKEGL